MGGRAAQPDALCPVCRRCVSLSPRRRRETGGDPPPPAPQPSHFSPKNRRGGACHPRCRFARGAASAARPLQQREGRPLRQRCRPAAGARRGRRPVEREGVAGGWGGRGFFFFFLPLFRRFFAPFPAAGGAGSVPAGLRQEGWAAPSRPGAVPSSAAALGEGETAVIKKDKLINNRKP